MTSRFQRVKIVNADGGYQYRIIDGLPYEIQFAIMPRIKWTQRDDDGSVMVEVRKRRFEYNGRDRDSGIPVYMEVVE